MGKFLKTYKMAAFVLVGLVYGLQVKAQDSSISYKNSVFYHHSVHFFQTAGTCFTALSSKNSGPLNGGFSPGGGSNSGLRFNVNKFLNISFQWQLNYYKYNFEHATDWLQNEGVKNPKFIETGGFTHLTSLSGFEFILLESPKNCLELGLLLGRGQSYSAPIEMQYKIDYNSGLFEPEGQTYQVLYYQYGGNYIKHKYQGFSLKYSRKPKDNWLLLVETQVLQLLSFHEKEMYYNSHKNAGSLSQIRNTNEGGFGILSIKIGLAYGIL